MPRYDYKCSACGAEEEIKHPVKDCDQRVNLPCSDCECTGSMHRVIKTVPTVAFLGPGFASNDHVARANVGRNPNNQTRYSK